MAVEVDTVAAREGNGIAGRGTEEELVGHQQILIGHQLCARHCSGHGEYSRGVDRQGPYPLG